MQNIHFTETDYSKSKTNFFETFLKRVKYCSQEEG